MTPCTLYPAVNNRTFNAERQKIRMAAGQTNFKSFNFVKFIQKKKHANCQSETLIGRVYSELRGNNLTRLVKTVIVTLPEERSFMIARVVIFSESCLHTLGP